MTPDPDARRRALEQILVNGIGAPPEVRLQPVDLTPLAPARLEQPQEGIATTFQPVEDEEAQLRAQADEAVRFANLGEVSSRAIEGLTGARGADIWTPMRQRADEPLKAFLALQQRKVAKPTKSTDPNSPESRRAQAIVKATLGDVYADEEVAAMSEADAENALKYGSMRGTREVSREGTVATNEREKARLSQQGRIWAQRMNLEYDKMSAEDQRAADRMAEAQAKRTQDAEQEAAKTGRQLSERNVGGFSFDPANPPSADAAKQMAQVAIQSKTLTGSLDVLEKMYREHGSEALGDKAGTMGGEWKNITDQLRMISNMGVPNGRDWEMLAKQLEDPTTASSYLTSKSRGLAQMSTVRKQIERLVSATADAYKYKPGNAAPVVVSPPTTPTRTPTRPPQASEALKWARQHPDDPRAAEILKRLGARP